MLKFPAYFTGFGSKADGSASLRFGTQELTAEDFAELKRNQNQFGWLMFQETGLSLEDMPKEPIFEDKEKTPSKRLRSVLFIKWKQTGNGDFESFYRAWMEEEITRIKTQLDS